MNNLSLKIKKALSNKNVATALGFILIGIILIIGYRYRINLATSPVKVPYALKTIQPQTKITADMIGLKEVARNAVDKDLIYTTEQDVLNKYATLESTIYEGSFFYRSAVVEKDSLPTSALLDIASKEGYTLLKLGVDMETSYYNSLVPGDYFDIYVRTIGVLTDEKKTANDEIIVGKLISDVKILAVKTDEGENVFGTDEARTPAGVLFALPEDQALLLMKAEYFTKLQDVAEIEFVIVPRGSKYKAADGETVTSAITSDKLEKYIKDKTKDIDIKQIQQNSNLNNNNNNN